MCREGGGRRGKKEEREGKFKVHDIREISRNKKLKNLHGAIEVGSRIDRP